MKRSKTTKITLVIIFLIRTLQPLIAQEQEEVKQVQPTIMVMPYKKDGSHALELFENDFRWKAIVLRINNAFQERGFRPKDLQETINQVKKKTTTDEWKNANVNVDELMYAEARTDVIVKAYINIEPQGGGKEVVGIALQAIELSSRSNLYDMPIATSPPFPSKDQAYIVDRLLTEKNRADNFINGLNGAFTQTLELGKSITLDIITTDDCQCRLGDEIGKEGDFVSEIIIEWIQNNAHKNQYRIKQDSENMLSFDEIRIPLRTSDGRNYSINDFARKLSRALFDICKRKENFSGKRTKPSVSEGTIRAILP